MSLRLLFVGWTLVAFALFLYSFTQIDLSLTFSSASIWQDIQKSFQYIGYFKRDTSTYIFSAIAALWIIQYGLTLLLVHKGLITRRQVWAIIGVVTAVLFTSYNAFSHDIFNYIFDAKIITYYHQNPYIQRALDYPTDPMLSFMHWTHRTYPYGPFWLVLTVPLSFIGSNIFIITFYLFKLLMTAGFLGSLYFIEKIAGKIKSVNPLFALVFFALNPLVVIEVLVSGHNDIVMMAFALAAFYFFIQKKQLSAALSLVVSIGTKFATAFLLPSFILAIMMQIRNKKVMWDAVILFQITAMLLAVVAASLRTNFQPWYLLYVLPFAALLSARFYVFIPSMIVSFVALFMYAPYLYLGNWDDPVPQVLDMMTLYAVIGSILITIIVSFRKKIFSPAAFKKSSRR